MLSAQKTTDYQSFLLSRRVLNSEILLNYHVIINMKNLKTRSLLGFINLFFFLCVLLFLPAWSFNFWEAWLYLFVFFIPVMLITLYFLKKDPDLIERRLKAGPLAEKRFSQKIIQAFASLFFVLILILPGIDHRLNWSHVPFSIVIIADIFIGVGFVIVFYAFKVNNFISAVVEVAIDQNVITTGVYSVVRHPMYSGAVLLLFFTPLALGSWYAMVSVIPMVVVIILRLKDEEELLLKSLKGYKEYCQKVQYRLIPFVW
jgi:protein-S-isoprenylcysteine O-methyltransferase Ste14